MHRHSLHNAVFWEKCPLMNTPIPQGYTWGPNQKWQGLRKKKNSCRHNSMSHCSAVLHPRPCPSCILTSLWLLSVWRQTDFWWGQMWFVIRIKMQSRGMLKVGHVLHGVLLITPATRGCRCTDRPSLHTVTHGRIYMHILKLMWSR